MNINFIRHFLLWCTVINYCILLVWFFALMFAHDCIYRFHTKWFRLTPEQFDTIHYTAMAVYKIGILLFNLVPYIVLLIIIH
ncbi:DUF6868 family protein [Pedosphaera parvula]|uniref:DUF6868 domain-containing protein n=1 Tax=Pedosphaera parvula (strain Ellin514) TaxID=320771 RepID=B9XET5_PEDPL|nr:hypothetical protein [Pedosphaera parvula]EEF61799.1 conserved hypothetical protein [Pedosphaera parvula Ellin514]